MCNMEGGGFCANLKELVKEEEREKKVGNPTNSITGLLKRKLRCEGKRGGGNSNLTM